MKNIKKWLAPVIIVVAIALAPSALALISLPYTFTSGQPIEAAKVNANDQALRDGINGHISATNPHNTTLAQILAKGNSAGVNAINFNGVGSLNFEVENVTADPTCNGGATGRLIYNTIDELFKICNGSSFVSIAGTGVNTLASVLSAGNSASTFNIDLNSNQLLNARIENRTSDGASVLAGRVFIRTDTGDFKVCNGVSCTALGGAQGLSSVLGVSNSAGSTNIDFNGNQAVKLRAEVLASDPATTYSGRVYYNSVDNNLKYYDAGTSTFRSVGNTNTLSQTLVNGNSAGSTNLDLNNNQALKFRVENLSGTPGTGNAGRMYYDTTATKLMYAESATNRAVVAEDKTQTLTNKSISGSSNTITNVPDSALSANVSLLDGVQTVSGKKSFNTGKISVADISTPSGSKHILTDGLADDTITLNNAVQTLNGKTLGASSFTGNVNFTQHQLVNARVENRGFDPTPGNAGRIFYKTATGEMAYDDGTSIRVLTSSASSGFTPWSLDGNSGIDDTLNFIGTTDAQDLVVKTNGSEVIRFTDAGAIDTNLGVGIAHLDASGVMTSSTIVNADVNASAAIALTKLAATTVSRALVSDGSGFITPSSVTSTELGYLSGVTSAIQTQLGNKQPLDATLTSLAAYNTNGILTQTAADTFTGRTITGTANQITVTNGDGVSGNPTISIPSSAALPGSPTTTTQSASDNSTKIATTAYADSAVSTGIATRQPLDSDLTSIAALTGTGIGVQTAVGSWTNRTITGTTNQITVTNGDGVSGNPVISIPSSAALPGSPTTTTQSPNDNSTKIATTAYVDAIGIATYPRSEVWVYTATGTGGVGTTNTAIRRFATTGKNTGSSITYADSAANGASFTINETGLYSITHCFQFTGGTVGGISLNSSQLTTNIDSITASDRMASAFTSGANAGNCVTATSILTATDVVRPHITVGAGIGGTTVEDSFRITQVSK